MKKQRVNPMEHKCAACNGIRISGGDAAGAARPQIYPAPCRKCSGKGRVKAAAN